MLDELVKIFPTAGEVLALAPSQLDEVLLGVIAQRVTNEDPVASKYVSKNEIQQLYPAGITQTFQQCRDADGFLMEAWQRLSTGALIMQAPGQVEGMITLTRKGREVAGKVNFVEINARQKLSREMLHPEFRGAVYDNFASGHYDTSVRDAMVLVEDAVRTAASLPNRLVGVKLMREAFNPNTGKLTNMSLDIGDRERVADLFAGAIGTFKNPLSHRKVGKDDPFAVIEELMLASRLMRFLK